MRIINQNHDISYPFDKLVVWVDGNNILCEVIGIQRCIRDFLGTYESHERAKEVFNQLDKHYSNLPYMEDGATLYNLNSFVMPEE